MLSAGSATRTLAAAVYMPVMHLAPAGPNGVGAHRDGCLRATGERALSPSSHPIISALHPPHKSQSHGLRVRR
eukprot:3838686-Prymnesium_polylepis.1